MTIPEPISILAGAITEAVFGYILEKSGWAEEIRRRLGRDPEQAAFRRALEQAILDFQREHGEWYASLFDAEFFKHEGAPILAEFLRPTGEPDAALLAEYWARSLRSTDDPRRHELAAQCEPAAYTLLALLADALKDQAALRDLNNERRFERIVENSSTLLEALGAGRKTPFTRRSYLHWLVDRNLYLDARGVMQTQRQVQLKLDEIYVSLAAQPEPEPASLDRRQWEDERARLEEEMDAAGLPDDEREDRRDLLLSRLSPPMLRVAPVELHALVREHSHLAVLGDPGSGKTTLLRYLALHHAQSLLAGRRPGDPSLNEELGVVRFPIFLRVANYVEAFPGASKALTDALGAVYQRADCPAKGLQDLLSDELEAGDCLVLLDGLDEIVQADDRRKVVTAIENFVRRHQGGGRRGANHFVVTSRSAGYRSAPLAAPFAHFTVQEMDETQIRRFLERWCRAVEDTQRPDVSPETRRATAEAEVKAILDAVQNNRGVRRLASNPLLLRILALIHRTSATLPQRRIELYKLAADTLTRTWRLAQGVPESALIEDRFLTSLLGKLAHWMHLHKPSGLATEREVYDLLGREYARQNGLDWEEGGDNPLVAAEVEKFLLAVREHTGLFVERAPRRYGFMHLTFEEYYAARDLVARPRETARRIRQHLHDPRWDEPILLALGFVGLDYPEEAAELVDTAILAQGEEAQALGFTSSRYEEWLGRDYRFALRCAGDLIPLKPATAASLVLRLQSELLSDKGLGQFLTYWDTIYGLLPLLVRSSAGSHLIHESTAALNDRDWCVRSSAVVILEQLGQATPKVITGLLAALRDEEASVGSRAAVSLGRLGQATPEVMTGLLLALHHDNSSVRSSAADSLGQLKPTTIDVVNGLVSMLRDTDWVVRSRAAESLGALKQATSDVVDGLLAALRDDYWDVRFCAAASLLKLGSVTQEVITDLLTALSSDDAVRRRRAAENLGLLQQATLEVITGLLTALHDNDGNVRSRAAVSLGQLKKATPEVVASLLTALCDEVGYVRSRAAEGLGWLGHVTPNVVMGLLTALRDKDKYVRFRAAASLGKLGQATPEVIVALLTVLRDDHWEVRFDAATSLGKLGQTSPEVVKGLLNTLLDEDGNVRSSAAKSLGQLGRATPEIVAGLLDALRDSAGITRSSAAASLVQLGKRDAAIRQLILDHVLALLGDVTNLDAVRPIDKRQQAYRVLFELAAR